MKCEKIQLTRFQLILDEDVSYSIVVENSTVEETRDMFKAFAMLLCLFLYIQFAVCEKKLEATFLLIQKLFLPISDKRKVLSEV